ncbi:hypothetical protein GCM10023188_37370 [Pontibacter saemangeumensis]|uniref:Glycosyltransferase RgtA/B/C/D-like domain-containing protein n=1 Tax=Pontibacter saemangeumensis TaxID=1084525 RepID=A0ABP8M050_9BACT
MSVLVYMLNLLLLGALVWAMRRQEWAQAIKPFFYPALFLKMICGVLLGWLYFEYYGAGDTIAYHQMSTTAADVFREQGIMPYSRYLLFDEVTSEQLKEYREAHYMGAWNVIKLFSLLNLITAGHYYLMALYLALFSFSGSGYLVFQLMKRYPHAASSAIFAFLFLPSVVFWSSGLLKESLVMGGIGFFVGAAVVLDAEAGTKLFYRLLLLFASLALIWFVKYFIAAAIGVSVLVGALVYVVIRSGALARLHLLLKAILLLALLLLTLWVASNLNYNLQFDHLPEVVVDNYHKYLAISVGKPHVEFENLLPTYFSLFLHAPLAVLWILFRPFLWEGTDLIHFLAGAESLVLLLLTIWSIYGFLRQRQKRLDWFIISMWLFSIMLAVLLTYSMPNLGTLNRYRIVFLPFFVYLLCLNPCVASTINTLAAKLTGK